MIGRAWMGQPGSQALSDALARVDDALGDAVAIARRASPADGRPLLLRALRDASMALRQAQETAGRVAESRGNGMGAAGALHDLRTPLTAILGWIQLVRGKGFEKATTVQAIDTIERNATMLAQMLDRLSPDRASDGSRKGRRPIRLAG
jgi:signal transduction histidine kinase